VATGTEKEGGQEEPKQEEEELIVVFSQETVKSPHVPVFVLQKENEEYGSYITRIKAFLTVRDF
jgi:hypothetical protein